MERPGEYEFWIVCIVSHNVLKKYVCAFMQLSVTDHELVPFMRARYLAD